MGETAGGTARAERARTLQRITAFTDAVVAIALTLLVLPLVNIADKSRADEPLFHLLAANRGDIFAAGVSFLVIAQFWRTHRQLYEGLVDYNEGLLTFNTFWLMAVLFLPFPTARLFTEAKLRTDSTILYLGTMLVISLLALGQLWWLGRHPSLCEQPGGRLPRRALLPPVALSVTFAAATLVAVFSPIVGLLVLIAVLPVRYATRRLAIGGTARQPSEGEAGQAGGS